MPINLKELKETDKGRLVLYEGRGSSFVKKEKGYLKSWNDYYVFVRFHTGDTAAGCDPDCCTFIEEEDGNS